MVDFHKSANHAWAYLLREIMNRSKVVSPRGQVTYEILRSQVTFPLLYPLVTLRAKNHFAATEALWILEGRSDLETIEEAAPSYGRFSDDGMHLAGAYGPKFVSQVKYVVDALADDQQSRQAVMTMWERNPRPSRDIPCTIALQFLIRDQLLHTIVTMRSCDTWLGFPYDVFSFSMVTAYVALLLRERHVEGIGIGHLTMQVGSQHLYEKDWEKVAGMALNEINEGPTFVWHHIKGVGQLLGDLRCVTQGLSSQSRDIFFRSMAV